MKIFYLKIQDDQVTPFDNGGRYDINNIANNLNLVLESVDKIKVNFVIPSSSPC